MDSASTTVPSASTIPICTTTENWYNFKRMFTIHANEKSLGDTIFDRPIPLGARPLITEPNYWTNLAIYTKIKETEAKAYGLIYRHLDEYNRSIIQDETSAYECWKKLKAFHSLNTSANSTDLYNNFMNLKLDNSIKATDYTATCRNLVSRMISNNNDILDVAKRTNIPDNFLSQMVINNMEGSDWQDLKNSIIRDVRNSPPTFHELLTMIDRVAFNQTTIDIKAEALAVRSGLGRQGLGNNNRNSNNNNTNNQGQFRPNRCTAEKHNENASHPEADCFIAHPERKKEVMNRYRGPSTPSPSANVASTSTSTATDDKMKALEDKVDELSGQLLLMGFDSVSGFVAASAAASTITISSEISEKALDSGADISMARGRESFVSTYLLARPISITTADGGKDLIAREGGTIRMYTKEGLEVLFPGSLLVPGLKIDLISVGSITKEGGSVNFAGSKALITLNNKIKFTATRKENSLYLIDLLSTSTSTSSANLASTSTGKGGTDLQGWHLRTGHLNLDSIMRLSKDGLVSGVNVVASSGIQSQVSILQPCASCSIAKNHRLTISKVPSIRSPTFLGRIHSDIIGPIQVPSTSGARYVVTFLDDHSRFLKIYFLKNKSEAFEKFIIYKKSIELETGLKIIRFRTDKGGEYTSKKFYEYLENEGITKEEPSSYSHEENGMAERANRTLFERGVTMLRASGLPLSYWAEAVNTACYLYNISPHSGNDYKVPLTQFFKHSKTTPNYIPDLSHIRPFGCLAFVHVPKELRKKLDDKAKIGIMLGYQAGSKSYRILTEGGVVKIAGYSATTFQESHFPRFTNSTSSVNAILRELKGDGGVIHPNFDDVHDSDFSDDEEELIIQDVNPLEGIPALEDINPVGANAPVGAIAQPLPQPVIRVREAAPSPEPLPPIEEEIIPLDRIPIPNNSKNRTSSRIKVPIPKLITTQVQLDRLERQRKADRSAQIHLATIDWSKSNLPIGDITALQEYCALLASSPSPSLDAPTERQALAGPNASEWQAAMAIEVKMLDDRGTGVLVPPSSGSKIIGGRWVLTTKRDEDGKFIKRKARWVALGYLQQFGLDYDETFASVARAETIRLLIAFAAHGDHYISSFDVTGAFLAGKIDVEGILVSPPSGFPVAGKENWVWELKKPLYGLKQAPRCWKDTIHKFLLSLDFLPSPADDCLYLYRNKTDFILLSIHVDDGLLVSNSTPSLHTFRDKLFKEYESKWIDEPTTYLGINITRDRSKGEIYLSQHTYISTLLERNNMSDCATNSVPIPAHLDLSPATEEEVLEALDLPFRGIIGGLNWAALGSRPDIAQSVGALSQHSAKPSARHYIAAKGILRYLKGTINFRITYSKHSPFGFSPDVYSDANWAGDLVTRRSTTGYVVMVAGGAVHWSSRRQPTVALSTTEAEYMALTETAKHVMWVRSLLPTFDSTSSSSTSSHSSLNKALPSPPTIIKGDNEGSIALAKNPGDHKRTKHIDIRHHFIREKVAEGTVILEWVPTAENVADVFTKTLSKELHFKFCQMMGLKDA